MQNWVYVALISGFLGFYALFIDINKFIKAIAILGFLSCFLSSCPLLSFKDYPILIGGIYLYYFLTKLKNWNIIFNLIFTLLIFNSFFAVMQIFNQDTLLNWGIQHNVVGGINRNLMQLKSLIIISLAFIIAYKKPRFIKSKWFINILVLSILVYINYHHSLRSFINVRFPVWKEISRLDSIHPFMGWGLGSFKFMFQPLSQGMFKNEGIWLQAHNDWLQILFEMGKIGLLIVLGYVVSLIIRMKDKPYLLIGSVMIGLDMCVHFPLHQKLCTLIIICFLAYCEREVKIVC